MPHLNTLATTEWSPQRPTPIHRVTFPRKFHELVLGQPAVGSRTLNSSFEAAGETLRECLAEEYFTRRGAQVWIAVRRALVKALQGLDPLQSEGDTTSA